MKLFQGNKTQHSKYKMSCINILSNIVAVPQFSCSLYVWYDLYGMSNGYATTVQPVGIQALLCRIPSNDQNYYVCYMYSIDIVHV